MPTIAHSLLGGAISLILYAFTRKSDKRFTNRMVILLSLNSFIGPDLLNITYTLVEDMGALYNIHKIIHSIIGWPIWCLGIVWLFYYVINIKASDEDKLSLLQIYLILIAGGFFHFGMDLLTQSLWIFGIPISPWNEATINLNTFLTGDDYPEGPLHALMPWFSMGEMFIIGIAFLICMIYALMKDNLKLTIILSLLFLTTLLVCYWLFGSLIFGEEEDIGITLFYGAFFIGPLLLCFASFQNYSVEDLEKRKKEKKEFKV